jgi:hypothetical protein
VPPNVPWWGWVLALLIALVAAAGWFAAYVAFRALERQGRLITEGRRERERLSRAHDAQTEALERLADLWEATNPPEGVDVPPEAFNAFAAAMEIVHERFGRQA